MKYYVVWFTCPNCKHPCTDDPNERGNECIEVETKAEAIRFFNQRKPCRNMKICAVDKIIE